MVRQRENKDWKVKEQEKSIEATYAFMYDNLRFGLPRWLSSKESPASAGDTGDWNAIPGSIKIPLEEEMANPLQYFCLENSRQKSLADYSPWGCEELDMT